jgi:hypothetical protein
MLSTLGKTLSGKLIDSPVFIVGGSRSGTIVLLKALGKHPLLLSSPSENPFMTDLGRMAYDLGNTTEQDRHYYERTLRVPHEYVYDTLRRLAFESSFGPYLGLKFFASQLLRHPGGTISKRYWCTKTFPGKRTAQGLQVLYPNTRFIWILRNGMNVVFSRARFPEFKDQEFSQHCEHWAASIERFSYLKDWSTATIVHQEELTDDPDAVFRRIFELFGVPYHKGPTQYALHTHVHPLADEGTTTGVNVKQVLKERSPPFESWSEDQRATFKELCGKAMLVAGYEVPF